MALLLSLALRAGRPGPEAHPASSRYAPVLDRIGAYVSGKPKYCFVFGLYVLLWQPRHRPELFVTS
jgi:hypothetical protein